VSKKIPQKALKPLTELCKLLNVALCGKETWRTILAHLLETMSAYSDYCFSQPWPNEYDFRASAKPTTFDLDFVAQGGKDEVSDRLYAVCLKKNISMEEGFTPLGFFWTYWALAEEFAEDTFEMVKLKELRDNAAFFAKAVLGWNPFPYQESLVRDQSNRIVCCWGRQCGKTSTIAIKAIHFAYCNPNVNVLIASPSLRQSMIMFDRILGFIYSGLILPSGVSGKTRTVVRLLNGSGITALPCSENLLRGYTADLVICDEAAFMPEDIIIQVVFPMLSTTNGTAIFLSTPWGRDHFFYRAFMDPKYSVHHVKSTECPLMKPEFLEEQRHNMSEEAFRMEYLAEFVEAATCFFSQDLIRSCVDSSLMFASSLEDRVRAGEYYAGSDFGKLDDYSVLSILRREGELLKLVYLHEFPLGTAYSSVIGHLVRADQKFRFRKVLVDQTGVGEPVLEELKAQGVQNVEGLIFTVKTKEELLTCLKLAMEQKRLKIPYDRRLCEQINQHQYEYSKSGHLTFSHPPGSYDDQLWSLALSCYAGTVRRELPPWLVRLR